MDDGNDVRQAIGMLVNAVTDIRTELRELRTELRELRPAVGAVARVDQLAGDLDAVLSLVPGAMRQAAAEPPLSLMVGDRLTAFADEAERTLAARRSVGAELVGADQLGELVAG